MSRLYEVMFIVRPDLEEEEVDKLIAGFESSVTNGGCSVKSVEKMGRRKLAYDVRKFSDGNYILLNVESGGDVVHELDAARASGCETRLVMRPGNQPFADANGHKVILGFEEE